MSRLNSFYLAQNEWPQHGNFVLSGKEAYHLSRVLRHEVGDTVRLFDGHGRYGLFKLLAVNKRECLLELLNISVQNPPQTQLTLALAWNKSSRRDWLLEKSVELQGGGIYFWQAQRSQGHLPSLVKNTWQERIIQAAKQCGSLYLPQLAIAQNVDELIRVAAKYKNRFLLWESQDVHKLLMPDMLLGSTFAIIGPEGGIPEQEAQLFFDAGFIPLSLGTSVLRWETAALHCLSLAFFAQQST